MGLLHGRGYRVDFIALHWYGGDFRTQAAVGQLKSYVQAVYKRYRKPIRLTEYALIDFSNGTRYATDAQQAAFVTASTRMPASLPYVRRYAWFGLPSSETEPGSGLFRGDGTATRAGRAFQAARCPPDRSLPVRPGQRDLSAEVVRPQPSPGLLSSDPPLLRAGPSCRPRAGSLARCPTRT
ncbi:glycoside hydrolase family protein [Streptosporangium sp. NBC_01755]|uniref:glycosyl hydrolase n=1 Tax=Streptosporangium sp. NBC_01755 TaxID=2975949 RepID=UPI002DDAAFD7|nr:glycosyl hydrolase [Streptosporangium sp. NBC_01755]WSC99657.1 glycoside hydrolase family protein [Streptosporangium sp. NBC_01755]